MRRLIPLLLFWPLLVQASIYTATWCPVKGFTGSWLWYETCVETTSPIGQTCNGSSVSTGVTSASFILPDNATAWFRVRAVTYTGMNTSNFQYVRSAYSNPVQIISGLTPPAIGGCF